MKDYKTELKFLRTFPPGTNFLPAERPFSTICGLFPARLNMSIKPAVPEAAATEKILFRKNYTPKTKNALSAEAGRGFVIEI